MVAADRWRASIAWPVVVGLGALAYFLIGIRYAVGWESGWIDSGLVVYGAWRTLDGALPYRDFDHIYGPALFYWNAALFRWFGVDLAVVVGSLAVLKALLATAVFAATAQTGARPGQVAAAVVAFVALWGAPLWLFSAPYAQHYAMLGSVSALAIALRAPRSLRAAFAAGLCCGVAATFKLTAGPWACAGLVLGYLTLDAPDATDTARRPAVRAARWGVAAAIAGATAVYVALIVPAGRGAAAWATAALMGAPLAWCAMCVAAAERVRSGDRARDAHGLRLVAAIAAGTALPLLGWIVFYADHGALWALRRDLLMVPPRLGWFIALPLPGVVTALTVAALVAWVCLGGWRGGLMLAATVAAATWWWRPVGMSWPAYAAGPYSHRLSYDLATFAPLVLVVCAVRRLARPTLPPSYRQCTLFGAAQLLLMLPAADLWHALMVMPALLPLLVVGEGSVERRLTRGGVVVWLLVAIVCVPYVVQLRTARRDWATATAQFPRATGLTHPDPKFADVGELARYLDAAVPPDRTVVVLTGEAMIYFLAGRRSAWEQAEYVLQVIEREVDVPATAPLLTNQRWLIERLKTERPLVIDDRRRPLRPRLAYWYPALGRFLDARYRPRVAFGEYQVFDVRFSGGAAAAAPPSDLTTRGAAR